MVIHDSRNSSKLYLDKENFFEVDSIPKNSSFLRYIQKRDGKNINSVNFKELIHDATFDNIQNRGK